MIAGALIAAVAVAAFFAVSLSQSAPRLAGVDPTRLDAFSTVLAQGRSVCQTGEVVPPDAGAVSLVVGLFGGILAAAERHPRRRPGVPPAAGRGARTSTARG